MIKEFISNTQELEEWKRTGWKVYKSHSKPGVIRKLNWTAMEDRLKYNLLEKANKLTMPVLLIVGDKDTKTPPEHQKILFKNLPGKKELHIIKGSPHTFTAKEHLKEVKGILNKWIIEQKL